VDISKICELLVNKNARPRLSILNAVGKLEFSIFDTYWIILSVIISQKFF
jgi:hypothetical protein